MQRGREREEEKEGVKRDRKCMSVCMYVFVCICERERKKEKEKWIKGRQERAKERREKEECIFLAERKGGKEEKWEGI